MIRELNNRLNWLTGRGIIDLLLELLPIELTDFRATPEEAFVLLEWRTATELNNDFMAVERSPDGSFFTEIGRVTGKGTTYQPQFYSFFDEKPLDGLNYYRLRQVDFDGTITYHRVVAVTFRRKAAEILVFPNQAHELVMVRLPEPNVQRTIWRIFDLNGRQMAAIPVGTGLMELEIDIHHLTPGVYLLEIAGPGNPEIVRFVKY